MLETSCAKLNETKVMVISRIQLCANMVHVQRKESGSGRRRKGTK